MDKNGVLQKWVKKHTILYKGATRHPFITTIHDGTVDISSFKTWLGQDYIFVRSLVPFVASVLVKACKESEDDSDMDIILGGIAALNDELTWFKKEASKWNMTLNTVVPLEANLSYQSFVESLMCPEVDYTVAITAFWAIESVYQESFGHCLEEGSKTPQELRETCHRWGNDAFARYCLSLEQIVNRRLERPTDDVVSKAEVAFLQVLELEVEFWNMSNSGT